MSHAQGPPVDNGEPDVVLPGGGQPYGGFWWRVLAALLDGVILIIPLGLVFPALIPVIQSIEIDPSRPPGLDFWLRAEFSRPFAIVYFANTMVFALYYTGFESSSMMATPGKRIADLRVTDAYGRRLTVGQALARSWVWWLGGAVATIAALIGPLLAASLLSGPAALLSLISCVLVAFNARKQGIHDRMAGCLVTKRKAVFRN